MGVFAQFAGNSPVAPVPQEIRAEDNPELGTVAPGMMGNQRPPPPGCPPGGQFLMVKYEGPKTQKYQQSYSRTCCIIGTLLVPAFGAGIICCLLVGWPPVPLKDEKEVYQVGGRYYSLNGRVDTNVGDLRDPPRPQGFLAIFS